MHRMQLELCAAAVAMLPLAPGADRASDWDREQYAIALRTCNTMTGALIGACGSTMTSSALAMRFWMSSRSAASCARVMLPNSELRCCCWCCCCTAVLRSSMACTANGVL